MRFVIPGEPIAKKRFRFAIRGKYPVTYNEQEKQVKAVQLILKSQMNSDIIDTPFSAKFTFIKSRPKSHFGTGKNSDILKKSAPQHVPTKPDLDNYLKFYLDCMNGIIIKDDSLLYQLDAVKEYGEPQTIIEIGG